MNIRLQKSIRTVRNEALCIIEGLTPIGIKLEVAQLYQITRRNKGEYDHDASTKNCSQKIYYDSHPKDWLQLADTVKITEHHEDNAIQIFTEGSKSSQGVGAGIAILIQNKMVSQRVSTSMEIAQTTRLNSWLF